MTRNLKITQVAIAHSGSFCHSLALREDGKIFHTYGTSGSWEEFPDVPDVSDAEIEEQKNNSFKLLQENLRSTRNTYASIDDVVRGV